MNPRFLWGYVILGVGILVVLANTLFVVDQREQALVLRFGDPVRVINPPSRPGAGLHAKLPFLENVIRFDRRNISIEAQQEEIIAADQERLVVDAFLRYRIADPLAFYRTLRDERTAADRIDRLLNSSLRQVLGTASSNDIVSDQRAQLMQRARSDMARRAQVSRFGIEVIDLRIRRADLPQQNLPNTYRRMQTSREQEAARLRAVGEQQKREIIANADREVTVTLATAREQAGAITGEGDAERTRILGQSFGRDASFAAFWRSMQAYEASLAQGDTTMVLSPDSAFFRYFERGPSATTSGRR
jgi:membrane protease subunit HflC